MDAVARLLEAIDALPDDLSNDEVAAAFAASDRLTARLSASLERLDPAADGAVNLRQWLRYWAHRSDHEAGLLVKRTVRLRSCPITKAAWRDGSLATGQVDAVVGRLSDRTEALFAEHEPDLVPFLVGLLVRNTDAVMRRWAAYADALVDAPPPDSLARRVFLSDGIDGWGELSGRLDPAAALVVRAALDAATTADVDGEVRTSGQRRADAMVAISRHYLDHAATATTSRGSRPDVGVVITLDELERGAGRSVDGAVLDRATVGALLCDAGVHRMVTDGCSVTLDAGRTRRTVGHHLFSALVVRDGGCRFPGCDRPVSWCEAHHVVPWEHGGETNQGNLVLLCWRHHHDFAHHPQWQLKLLPDGTVEVTKPNGTTLTSRPPPPTALCERPVTRRWNLGRLAQ